MCPMGVVAAHSTTPSKDFVLMGLLCGLPELQKTATRCRVVVVVEVSDDDDDDDEEGAGKG